jgi:membrane-bound lytic murein transglycosylase A
MKSNSPSAASASRTNSHMPDFLDGPQRAVRHLVLPAVILGTLAACGVLMRHPAPPAPAGSPGAAGTGAMEAASEAAAHAVSDAIGLPPVAVTPAVPAPPSTSSAASGAAAAADLAAEPAVLPTARGRWVAADWAALPGWADDGVIHAWPALLRSCDRATGDWVPVCEAARALAAPDEATVRAFLRERLRPWRVEAADGQAEGLMTGYFEPLIEASRQRSARFAVPLYAPPADIEARVPWYTRAQIDLLPAARQALHGREVAWVQDPLDALVLQIQGSGRVMFRGRDGTQQLARMAYAAHNGQPYQSVARWLVERNAFTLEQASWPAIRDWARANPQRVKEMLHANPRYVFFREEPLPDPAVGPLGAQGVPLTPGRSIAVDKDSIPYGTPVWIASTEPPAGPALLRPGAASGVPPVPRPLQRLVVAQDTGAAITGAVRADYFWGWGPGADLLAGRMKQPVRMWALWPRK